MRRLLLPVLLCFVLLAGCGGNGEANLEQYRRRPVTLPDGTIIQVESMTHKIDMGKGMMFRDSLPEGQGMLFIHGQPGKYSYWMYQVKVPLDIIWMDARGTIVEISENTPPCQKPAAECPNWGGTKDALVVLELPGGYGRKHGVALGQTIRF